MPAERPTILQIIPELDTGGAELSTIEIADAVVRAGGRALVLSEGGRLASRIEACGAEFLPFPAASKNPLVIAWNARRIAEIVTREGVDLVHARSRAPAWSAYYAATRTKRPFVTTYHGAYSENSALKKRYNEVMVAGDRVIANSGYTAALIKSRYDTPDAKIRIIHRGVDGARYDPDQIAESRRGALTRTWGVGPGRRIILQAARLSSWKGQGVVIEAARLMKERGLLGNTAFVLAGDAQGRDGYRAQLEHQIDVAGLGDAVRLVGHVDDIPAALSLSYLAVVASIEPEAFGRSATEAQAMRCPVIATNIGAPPETVLAKRTCGEGSSTGWLVPPGDAEALASVLESGLALSADERAAMGRRARTHVLENFTLHAMRCKTLAVYDELLKTSLERAFGASSQQS